MPVTLRRLLAPSLLLFLGLAAQAAEVSGVVRSAAGRSLQGAALALDADASAAASDASGTFRLEVASGEHVLHVSHAGFAPQSLAIHVADAPLSLEVVLVPDLRFSEAVTVQAVRADERAPLATSGIDRAELEARSFGQELPLLLGASPSVTYYSDSGTGAGYSYFYVRGILQTRVNATLDGAPLNEPEDSALYFADFVDFAGAVDSIQIQRGVGASSFGTATYGGSLNFASIAIQDRRELSAEATAGSFGTARAALALHSGALGPWALYGRGVYKRSDGFRDHSGVTQDAVYLGASRKGERTYFKAFGFSGRERTELAFLAVEKDVLERELRFNPLTPDEKDRFGQDFVQAQFTRFLGPSASLAVQGYLNQAGGFYRLRSDPDTLLQYGLDWRLLGGLATFNLTRGRAAFSAGLHLNDFRSRHTRDVVDGPHQYSNRGFKSEASGFAKLGYDAGPWHLYGDVQLRHARFRYEGGQPLGEVGWTFLNPRLGVRRALSPSLSAYASLGRSSREPARADMLAGEDDASLPYDLEAVAPERVLDVEAGLDLVRPGLELHLTAFAMEFHDEIALTGELSEIGLPLRRNVERSRRRGAELELRWRPGRAWRLTGGAALNRSRIAEWQQFYDVYDAAGSYLESVGRTHADVRPLLTPGFVANLGAEWQPASALALALQGRWVSEAYLDNANTAGAETPAIFTLDAGVTLGLSRWVGKGQPRLRVHVVNLLDDRRVWPSGYSYAFLTRRADGAESLGVVPYYYPQATRSVFVTADVRF
jgi:iron complex outermembrane receptor protein